MGGIVGPDALQIPWIVLWRVVISVLAVFNVALLSVLVISARRFGHDQQSREQRIANAIAGIREDRQRDRERQRQEQQQRSDAAEPPEAAGASSRRRWLP